MQRDESYLLDMLVAARKVVAYTRGVTWEAFHADTILQDAVMRQVQIVGEAGRALSDAFRQAHPEIPWQGIIGVRHRLVHHYFAIKLVMIWEVVERDIPALIGQLEPLAPPEPPAGASKATP